MSENPDSNTLDVDPTVTNPDTMHDAGLDLESLDLNNSKNETPNLGSRDKLDVDPTVTNPDTMYDMGLKNVGGGKTRTRKNKKKSAKRKRKSAKRKRKSAKKRTYSRRR